MRHLTYTEKQIIKQIVDDAGFPDVLRLLAGLVRNSDDCLDGGTQESARSILMMAAREIQAGRPFDWPENTGRPLIDVLESQL